jgi:hypothetical protein
MIFFSLFSAALLAQHDIDIHFVFSSIRLTAFYSLVYVPNCRSSGDGLNLVAYREGLLTQIYIGDVTGVL